LLVGGERARVQSVAHSVPSRGRIEGRVVTSEQARDEYRHGPLLPVISPDLIRESVPVIPMKGTRRSSDRHGRDRPGHDGEESRRLGHA
jgi:hypothetical protein